MPREQYFFLLKPPKDRRQRHYTSTRPSFHLFVYYLLTWFNDDDRNLSVPASARSVNWAEIELLERDNICLEVGPAQVKEELASLLHHELQPAA